MQSVIKYAEGMTNFQRYTLYCYEKMSEDQLLDALTGPPDKKVMRERYLDEDEWRGAMVEAVRQKIQDLKGVQ